MSPRRRLATLALWLGAMLACGVLILQARFVTDLSAFMPRLPSERQQLLVEQLRDGIIARLVMVGIEGGDAPARARASQALATQLRQDGAFRAVQNGDEATRQADSAYFFSHRYLLSPAVTPQRFTPEGLHGAIADTIEALSGGAGVVLKALLPRDPSGETQAILEQFGGAGEPARSEGVWASRDGARALLLLQLGSAGTDTDAQAQALERVRAAFATARAGSPELRLVMSGTSVFAVASRATIETEVRRLAIASSVLVIGLLLLVYRSLRLLLLGLLPVASGALAGIAAVSLGFGHVHALTLGFGTTLIGEAVDYSIYLFVQGGGRDDMRRFWATIRLGVLTSVTGFAALLFSGFPGLAQLGLYSIAGLLAAALVTRYVLPLLRPARLALRDLGGAGLRIDAAFTRAARWHRAVAFLLLAAAAVLVLQHGRIWNRNLSALSPIGAAEQKLDLELRSDLGAPDLRYIATFSAPDEESALQLAEQAGAVLAPLVRQGVLGSFNSPALVLPSRATQQARRDALPDAPTARATLAQALADLPLQATRLDGFVQDMQAARSAPLLTREDLRGTSAALLLDSLLVHRASGDWLVLMPLRPSGEGPQGDRIELPTLEAALQGAGLQQRVMLIDLLEETTALFDNYLHEAVLLSGLGCLAIVLLLLAALRSLQRTLRVVLPLACAVLCVAAALLLHGTQLTILHLVALLLVVAVGSNYALFFDGSARECSEADRRLTQTSLVIANLTTVASFGLLGFSQVPVLSAIGSTVGLGALLALLFSAVLARARDHAAAL